MFWHFFFFFLYWLFMSHVNVTYYIYNILTKNCIWQFVHAAEIPLGADSLRQALILTQIHMRKQPISLTGWCKYCSGFVFSFWVIHTGCSRFFSVNCHFYTYSNKLVCFQSRPFLVLLIAVIFWWMTTQSCKCLRNKSAFIYIFIHSFIFYSSFLSFCGHLGNIKPIQPMLYEGSWFQ